MNINGLREGAVTRVIAFGLIAACLLVYGQTLWHGFVCYDDGLYVTDNLRVQNGLTWPNLKWAFLTERAMYFHPLTWLSHMLDVTLFGLRPWGHHLTNLLLHSANSILLFFVIRRLTRQSLPSAIVAFLFAVHPLHVESVAWVAERKDVLSALFWIAAMGAYAAYAERPSLRRYLAVTCWFLLGFMAKPMVVTLPFALLLLDYWPLRRYEGAGTFVRRTGRLITEKLPWFALAAGMAGLTLIMQMRGDNLAFQDKVPMAGRVANALVAYSVYLLKTIAPVQMAVYYPHPISRPVWIVAGAALLMLLVTAAAVTSARRRPHWLVGWSWFLGTLLPVIELVQAGSFAYADRYMYLPSIGLFLAAAWELHLFIERRPATRRRALAATAMGLVGFTAIAGVQTRYWRDSEALFRHNIEITGESALANNNLGVALYQKGRYDEAMTQFERVLELEPDYARAWDNMALLYELRGDLAEAERRRRHAIGLSPTYIAVRLNLGRLLEKINRMDDAADCYRQALAIDPECAPAYYYLAALELRQNRAPQAADDYAKAVALDAGSKKARKSRGDYLTDTGQAAAALEQYRAGFALDPADGDLAYNVGVTLAALKRADDAAEWYKTSITLDPKSFYAHNNLGLWYLQHNAPAQAETHFRAAAAASPRFAPALNHLGIACATLGHNDDALRAYTQAIEVDPRYVNALLNRAALLLDLRQPEAASRDLQQVLAIDPTNAGALELRTQAGAK